MSRKMIIGLTGGIATGKSTVANMLRDLGITVLDADQVAREVVEPGRPAWKEIVDHFGPTILNEDQSLNRARLGEIIFSDPDARQTLNRITHPRVRAEMVRRMEDIIDTEPWLVIEVPLLIEAGEAYRVDEIWVVYADEETQMKRLMERNHLSEEEARKRIQAQLPITEKVNRANRVLDNNGSLESLQLQVEELVNLIWGQLQNQNHEQ